MAKHTSMNENNHKKKSIQGKNLSHQDKEHCI